MATYSLSRTLRLFNYARCIPCNVLTSFCPGRQTNDATVTTRMIYTTEKKLDENTVIEETVVPKKKKIFIPRITVISEKEEISVMTLEDAQKLAKRRSLKLVKMVDIDIKSERPVYKMMNIHDFVKEEAKSKAEAKEVRETSLKEDKTITVTSKIAEHDLNTKIRSMHKMLGKRHGVRAIISIDSTKEKAEEVRTKIIEQCAGVAKVVTKSDTPHHIKVTLRPIIEKQKDITKISNEQSDNQ